MSLAGMMPLSLTGGAGGAAGPAAGTSDNGLGLPLNTPFNFDSSGWVVNLGQTGSVTAGGNTGANSSQQAATPTANSSGSGASGYGSGTGAGTSTGAVPGAGTAGINASAPSKSGTIPLLLIAVGAFLILSHKV